MPITGSAVLTCGAIALRMASRKDRSTLFSLDTFSDPGPRLFETLARQGCTRAYIL
jgi:hypothetical protein